MATTKYDGATLVSLTDPNGPVMPNREGTGLMCSAAIAVADTTAADAAIFAFKKTGGSNTAYIKALYGSLIFNGTATATGKNGIYFERFTGRLAHTGGTAITAARRDVELPIGGYNVSFHTGALTATGVDYDGTKWGRYTIPISASGVALPFYVPFDNAGLALKTGEGFAMRLTYQAVVGLFVDLNVLWVESAPAGTDGE